jgi:hypothetical protein
MDVSDLGLTAHEVLDARLSIMSNAGVVAVALLSVAIAAIGGARANTAAGLVYFSISLVEWGIGRYDRRKRKELTPAAYLIPEQPDSLGARHDLRGSSFLRETRDSDILGKPSVTLVCPIMGHLRI